MSVDILITQCAAEQIPRGSLPPQHANTRLAGDPGPLRTLRPNNRKSALVGDLGKARAQDGPLGMTL